MRSPAFALLAALLASACAGPRYEGGVYRDRAMAFRLGETPSSWARIDVSDAKLAFRDDAAQTTTLVNGRCGQDAEDAPLEALRAHLFLLFTEREILEEERLPLDGREALRTVLSAKLDGVPKAFSVYVLKKDGCVYDFVQISPPEGLPSARPAFERFVAGFRTLPSD